MPDFFGPISNNPHTYMPPALTHTHTHMHTHHMDMDMFAPAAGEISKSPCLPATGPPGSRPPVPGAATGAEFGVRSAITLRCPR